MEKIRDGLQAGKRINGHAPGVTGRNLDVYAATGITDDHECSSLEEGMDRIRRGMTVLIREGSAARNLEALMGLFQDPWCRRSLLCTDDRHPADLQAQGHIDHVIRKAISLGADPVTAICMATVQTADYYGLKTKVLWHRGRMRISWCCRIWTLLRFTACTKTENPSILVKRRVIRRSRKQPGTPCTWIPQAPPGLHCPGKGNSGFGRFSGRRAPW